MTLKALSSIGRISEKYEEELFKVVGDSNLDVAVRVAAVETFRRLPCEKHRSYFESIFQDLDQDSELRIASYLQVMRCPTYLLVRKIAYNLRHEEVNQGNTLTFCNLSRFSFPLGLKTCFNLPELELVIPEKTVKLLV